MKYTCSDVLAEQSQDEVIRYFVLNYEFISEDYYEILLNIVREYFHAKTYKTKRIAKKSYAVICNNKVVESIFFPLGDEIYHGEFKEYARIEGWFNGSTYDEIIFKVICPKTIVGIDRKHIIQDAIKLCKQARDLFSYTMKNILSAKVRESTFIQYIEISYDDYAGYYNFGPIEVDFGPSMPSRTANKLAKCTIKHKKYSIYNDYVRLPCFEFIERASRVRLLLLQTFLRFPVAYTGRIIEFQPSGFNGKTYVVNRKKPGIDYILNPFNNAIIPYDIPDLFAAFDKLEHDKKSVYLLACGQYVEGLISDIVQAITNYVVSLEILASFDVQRKKIVFEPGKSKANHIWKLITHVIGDKAISEEDVDYMYNIRSSYVHEGLANNELKGQILYESFVADEVRNKVERITNYTLICWLKEEV